MPISFQIVLILDQQAHKAREAVHAILNHSDGGSFMLKIINRGKTPEAAAYLTHLFAGEPAVEVITPAASLQPGEILSEAIGRLKEDHLVFLREDSLLPRHWQGRIGKLFETHPDTLAATPLTNRFSPYILPLPPGTNPFSLDACLPAYSQKRYPPAFVGVGLTLFLNGAAIKDQMATTKNLFCAAEPLRPKQLAGFCRVADDLYCGHYAGRDVELPADWQRWLQQRNGRANFAVTPFPGQLLGAWDPRCQSKAVFFPKMPRDTAAGLRETARRVKKALIKRSPRNLAKALGHHLPRALKSRQARMAYSLWDKIAPKGLRVIYLVSNLVVSGGVFSIIQIVNGLILKGVDARIAFFKQAYEVDRWPLLTRPMQFNSKEDLWQHCPRAHLAVATHWSTAEAVRGLVSLERCSEAVYFLQDYEQWFYPETDTKSRQGVAHSYRWIRNKIVKSDWLAQLLWKDGHATHKIHMGLDLGLFYTRPERHAGSRLRILAMARPGTPRRGFPNVVETLNRVYLSKPDVEICLYGHDYLSRFAIPFPYRDLGVISDFTLLAQTYAEADIFFEGSDFQGFGRLSLEAMACGAACVLTNRGGLHEYAKDGENCLLVDPKAPAEAAWAILRLCEDRELRQRLGACAGETVKAFSHDLETSRTLAFFNKICDPGEDLAQKRLPPHDGNPNFARLGMAPGSSYA